MLITGLRYSREHEAKSIEEECKATGMYTLAPRLDLLSSVQHLDEDGFYWLLESFGTERNQYFKLAAQKMAKFDEDNNQHSRTKESYFETLYFRMVENQGYLWTLNLYDKSLAQRITIAGDLFLV